MIEDRDRYKGCYMIWYEEANMNIDIVGSLGWIYIYINFVRPGPMNLNLNFLRVLWVLMFFICWISQDLERERQTYSRLLLGTFNWEPIIYPSMKSKYLSLLHIYRSLFSFNFNINYNYQLWVIKYYCKLSRVRLNNKETLSSFTQIVLCEFT